MPDRRPPASGPSDRPPFQTLLAVLSAASALVLVVGVVRALVTGLSSPLLIAVAVVLAASLMLIRSLRRTATPGRAAGSGGRRRPVSERTRPPLARD